MLEYKDSGIEWIGEIPKDWEVSKIKYITKIPITDGPHETPEFLDSGVPFYSVDSIVNNKIIYYPSRYISVEDANRFDTKVKPILNDVLVGKAASTGKIAIVDENIRFQIWSPLALIRVKENYNPKYLMYYLLSDSGQIEIESRCTNNTQKNISMNDINKIVIVKPSVKEQKQIADFLDEKCDEIDDITSKIEKQIELLKDYKNSLITETVTKGLDKNIPMKDSGLEWIGKIPKDWQISRIKYSLSLYAGGDIDYSNFSDTKDKVYRYPILSNSLENQSVIGYTSKYRFYGETVTITGRGLVGVAFPRNEEFYPVVRLLVGIPSIDTNNRYIAYWINSIDILGEQTAMSQLTTDKLGSVEFVKPCLREQIKIADFLDKKCEEINSIISKKEKQLELIKEHKKSFIYEYVTGKKRVGGVMDGN